MQPEPVANEASIRSAALRKQLVEYLEGQGVIRTAAVRQAFLNVPRENFLPTILELEQVYSDEAIVVKTDATGAATSSSSQPWLMADMLEVLDLRLGLSVLEIGAGVGYNAALMGTIVGPQMVTSLDLDPEMAAVAHRNLLTLGPQWEQLQVIAADGAMGYAANAPYDRIVVTVQQWEIAPAWIAQLKVGGRLLLPLSVSRHIWNSLIPAFVKQADGTLQAVDGSMGGFMPMRGEFQHPVMAGTPRDAADIEDLLLLPTSMFGPTIANSALFYFNYAHHPASPLLTAHLNKLVFYLDSGLELALPSLTVDTSWNRLNPAQRNVAMQHNSFNTFLAMALQDQLGTVLAQTEIKPTKEADDPKAPPHLVLNSVGLGLLELGDDGGFDLAVLLRPNRVFGLRLLPPERDNNPSTSNRALARVAHFYRVWAQKGRLNINQYRPLAYPVNQLPPVSGFVIERTHYNLVLPIVETKDE